MNILCLINRFTFLCIQLIFIKYTILLIEHLKILNSESGKFLKEGSRALNVWFHTKI